MCNLVAALCAQRSQVLRRLAAMSLHGLDGDLPKVRFGLHLGRVEVTNIEEDGTLSLLIDDVVLEDFVVQRAWLLVC